MKSKSPSEKNITTRQVVSFVFDLRKWGGFGLTIGLILGLIIFYYFSSPLYKTQLLLYSETLEAPEINTENLPEHLNRILANPKYERKIFNQLHSTGPDQGDATLAKFIEVKKGHEIPLFLISSYLGSGEYIFTINLPYKTLQDTFEERLIPLVNLTIVSAVSDLIKKKQGLIQHYSEISDEIINNSYSESTYKESELEKMRILQDIFSLEARLLKIIESNPQATKLFRLSEMDDKKYRYEARWPEIDLNAPLFKVAKILTILNTEGLLQEKQLEGFRKELVTLKLESFHTNYKAYSIKTLLDTTAKNLQITDAGELTALNALSKGAVFTLKNKPIIALEQPTHNKRQLKTVAFALCGLLLGLFLGAFYELKKQIPE